MEFGFKFLEVLPSAAGVPDALDDLVHEAYGGDDVAGAPAERHRAVGEVSLAGPPGASLDFNILSS